MNALHTIYAGISSLSRKILYMYLTFLHTIELKNLAN